MRKQEVIRALEHFAPLPLQEDFDNAGLQVGLTEAEVSGALLCLDVTEAVIDEAISENCNLIISHHPLIYQKLSHITGENYVQRIIMKAIKHDITIVSMHTNMDNANGGVNYKMAEKLCLNGIEHLGEVRKYLNPETQTVEEYASGVVGLLPEAMPAADFLALVKRAFGVETVMHNQLLERNICRVALCGGSGSFLLSDAIAKKADAFITGEMRYHDYFGHEQEIQIAVIGHYQSEQYTSEVFRSVIKGKYPELKTIITSINTNPIKYT